MEEIILNNKKNGMQALLLIAALYLDGSGLGGSIVCIRNFVG